MCQNFFNRICLKKKILDKSQQSSLIIYHLNIRGKYPYFINIVKILNLSGNIALNS